MLDYALALARRGFAVFPLAPGTKRPLKPGGFHAATTDEAAIRAWWREEPEANVGVYPGATSAVVLDVDPRHGGAETLAELEEALGPVPSVLVVETPGGGRHYYMRLPEGVRAQSSAGRLGPGLDIRAEGGYVVGPGSVVDGRRYIEVTAEEF